MNDHRDDARRMPRMRFDTDAIRFRLLVWAETDPCPCCGLSLADAAGDIGRLLGQVDQLHGALVAVRLDWANLRAAIRAALGAERDGETDPLGFLRDEFPATGRGWSR